MSAYANYGQGSSNRREDVLDTYLNPFSNLNVIPKIPDGKATFSTGQRLQKFHQCVNSKLIFTLLPGFKHAYVCNPSIADTTTIIPEFQADNMGTDRTTGNISRESVTGEVQINEFPGMNIERLRLVSAGVSFMLTSSSSALGGSFKAYRWTSSNPNSETLTLEKMVNDTSFVAGKLCDIEKYNFQLKPVDTNHPFQNSTDLPDYDPSFDFLTIVMEHSSNFTVTFHTCHNFEVIFDTDSDFVRYHTSCIKDKVGLDKAQTMLMSSSKATTRLAY